MYIQDQLPHDSITDDNLSYYKVIGVDYLTINSLPLDLHTYPEMVEFLRGVRAPRRKKRPPPVQRRLNRPGRNHSRATRSRRQNRGVV